MLQSLYVYFALASRQHLCDFDAAFRSVSNFCPIIERLRASRDFWLTVLLCYSVNEPVIIRLKWGQTEYHGRLISVDSYMNVQLSNTEEFIDGKSTGTLGQVLIR